MSAGRAAWRLAASLALGLVLALGAACRAPISSPTAQGAGETADEQPLPKRYTLDGAASAIHFVGIKDNAVAVPGIFTGIRGSLDLAARTASIEIPIAGLATRDEERDRNLRTHLFAAGAHPLARFTVDGVDAATSVPAVGESVELLVNGVLELRGTRIAIDASVRLTRQAGDLVRVRTIRPLVLTSKELGLEGAFAVLKAVCGHESLSGAVPIEVDLLFTPAS